MIENSNTHPKRILVVEDEESIRIVCQRVLIGEGYEADTAPNGEAGKAKINERQYDLYLLDIKMPVLDGKELYKWLEKSYPDSANRVLFITGSVVSEDKQKFIERCGRPFLFKPFSPDELKDKVKACLDQNRELRVER